MSQLFIPLVNWNNGIIMIGVFAAVVLGLVIMLLIFMQSGKKEEE
ncbi:hypothetical protein MNBD_BACTEROID03-2057 [hydrothermal vent metagenome]|uniref:Uncharacterized protein n=1 Tax=hydrothermal vent metagenome TaxID=652676 RepID=A0A3B0T827_9ZZZZ